MRITNGMMVKNMMSNLNNNLKRMDKIQQQFATGKKFQLPSDDPIGVSKSLKLHTDLSKIEQYKRNLNDAKSWLEVTENSIAQIGDVMQRAREITVQAANGANSDDDLKSIKAEITQLKEQIVKVGNATYAGRSIFTGYKTDTPLLDDKGNYKLTNLKEDNSITGTNLNLTSDEISEYNVGVSDSIKINTVGSMLFGKVNDDGSLDDGNFGANIKGYTTDGSNSSSKDANQAYLVAIFGDLENALENRNSNTINKTLSRIDDSMGNLLSVRAEIGAKTNRLELTEKRLDSGTLTFTKLLSDNEDADMSEVIMKMKIEENVYRASLSAGAKIIQPSLIDFLR